MTKIEDLDLDTLKFVAKRIKRIHNWEGGITLYYKGVCIPRTMVHVEMIDVLIARKSGKRDPQVFSKELMGLIINDEK